MKKIGIVFLCVSLVWTAFIFSRSAKTATESSGESGRVMEILTGVLEAVGIENPPSEHFIRKAGHFTEYAILGLFAALAAWGFGLKFWQPAGLCYAFAVACADEFLVQRFSEGRAPQFTDVLIDSAGAATAVLCLFVIFLFIKVKKKKSMKNIAPNP